nr:hypothetical protein [Tanacetum cinerariifolium]
MSNTNIIIQTQTSNTLHNAIMEAGGKDRPPMLVPRNYVQWKSRIKRYIYTKPNHELIHYCLQNPPYKYKWADKDVPVTEGSSKATTERYMENYKNVLQDIRNQLNAEAEALQIILTGIDNYIYSRVDACPNACEMFVTLAKQILELKTVSYHKLYDILKQHQNEVNEIRAKRLARTANPLALVAQQQTVYHPQNHHTHYTQNFLIRSQQAATKNRGKVIVNSPPPIYDQEPSMVAEDDEMCSKHMTANLKLLTNFVDKFLGSVKFENDQITPILGYGDLVQGTVTIKRVYYVEGLNHNLFSVGQFFDADLEVAFQKFTCSIRDLKGNDLLIGPKMKHLKFLLISSYMSKEDLMLKDGENLDKMKEKGDACIFVGYSTQSRAYRVFNKRRRVIVETIHVNFDELPQMASDHVSSDPVPHVQQRYLNMTV